MRMRNDEQIEKLRSARSGSILPLLRWGVRVALLLALLFAVGLLIFISQIQKIAPGSALKADAIVVLTGGDSRVSEAVRLLADGTRTPAADLGRSPEDHRRHAPADQPGGRAAVRLLHRP